MIKRHKWVFKEEDTPWTKQLKDRYPEMHKEFKALLYTVYICHTVYILNY